MLLPALPSSLALREHDDEPAPAEPRRRERLVDDRPDEGHAEEEEPVDGVLLFQKIR